jgi:hypothetical protein
MIDLLFYGPFVQKLLHIKNFDIFHQSSLTLSPLENSLYVKKKLSRTKNHRTINCSISGASLLGVFFFVAERSEVLLAADRCVPRIFRRGPSNLYWMV